MNTNSWLRSPGNNANNASNLNSNGNAGNNNNVTNSNWVRPDLPQHKLTIAMCAPKPLPKLVWSVGRGKGIYFRSRWRVFVILRMIKELVTIERQKNLLP